MDNFTNENASNEINNTDTNINNDANINNNENLVNGQPNYNAQIYNQPVPQPGQFNSGVNYGSSQSTSQQGQFSQAPNYNQQAPQYNQAPNYNQAPVYNRPASDLEEPMSLGEWVGTILLSLIPCVNIVLLFVWAFSSTEKKSKSNWAKATLIIAGIGTILYIVFMASLIGAGLSFFDALTRSTW